MFFGCILFATLAVQKATSNEACSEAKRQFLFPKTCLANKSADTHCELKSKEIQGLRQKKDKHWE